MVLHALKTAWGGEIFIPKIPSYKITDVAQAIGPNCKHKVIGIRPGEKIHEEMITASDSFFTYDIGEYFVIVPQTQEGNGKTESPNPVGDDSKICETKHQKRNPFNSLPCHWEIFLSWLTGAEISLEFTGMSVGGTTSDAGQDTIWFDGVEGDDIDDEDAANNEVESQIMAGIASAFGDRKICRLDMILADIDSKLAVHFHEVRTGLTVPN